jgi:hypothetical protein
MAPCLGGKGRAGAGCQRDPLGERGVQAAPWVTHRTISLEHRFLALLWITSGARLAIVRWGAVLLPLVPQHVTRARNQLDDGIYDADILQQSFPL